MDNPAKTTTRKRIGFRALHELQGHRFSVDDGEGMDQTCKAQGVSGSSITSITIGRAMDGRR